MKSLGQRVWVNIDTNTLRANFNELSDCVGEKVAKMAVVKSNAYGHGMIECARVFTSLGADFLGVDSFEEAMEIRNAGISSPILVLGYTLAENFTKASGLGISLTISNSDSLSDAASFNTFLKVHIKVDTGLHRQGFNNNELAEVLSVIKKSPQLVIEGLYTHLAAAETPKLISFTKKQIDLFKKWVIVFNKDGIKPLTHVGASAAGILYKDMHFDMVRFGIALYGLWPSEETKKRAKGLRLLPALSWHSIVSEVKKINKGEPVGYDCTEKVKKNSVLAVVPIGYWHGFLRRASSKASVLINGKRAKVLGRVSMDMIVVDVTNIKNVKQGSEVTIIGPASLKLRRASDDEITAEELAKIYGTINYEVVTCINPLIPRIMN